MDLYYVEQIEKKRLIVFKMIIFWCGSKFLVRFLVLVWLIRWASFKKTKYFFTQKNCTEFTEKKKGMPKKRAKNVNPRGLALVRRRHRRITLLPPIATVGEPPSSPSSDLPRKLLVSLRLLFFLLAPSTTHPKVLWRFQFVHGLLFWIGIRSLLLAYLMFMWVFCTSSSRRGPISKRKCLGEIATGEPYWFLLLGCVLYCHKPNATW